MERNILHFNMISVWSFPFVGIYKKKWSNRAFEDGHVKIHKYNTIHYVYTCHAIP